MLALLFGELSANSAIADKQGAPEVPHSASAELGSRLRQARKHQPKVDLVPLGTLTV